jgi:hypothetical protein
LYDKSRFRYDERKDVCPAGAELTYRFATYELGRELRYYRASGCRSCALKKQCTRNNNNRTITREANEGLMEAMAAQPWKFKLRKTLAYNLKRVLNLVSFEKLMAAVGVKVPQRA